MCQCIVDFSDGEQASFYQVSIKTARKKYKCIECGCDIERGQRYENVRGKWEDEFDTIRTCMDCASIRDKLFCNGVSHGCLWSELEGYVDCEGTIDWSCLEEMTLRQRNKVLDLIQSVWDRLDREKRSNQ